MSGLDSKANLLCNTVIPYPIFSMPTHSIPFQNAFWTRCNTLLPFYSSFWSCIINKVYTADDMYIIDICRLYM